MSAERSKGETAIPLTSEQTKGVVEKILEKWGGENGICLTEGGWKELMDQLGPDTTVQEAIKILKGKEKTSD